MIDDETIAVAAAQKHEMQIKNISSRDQIVAFWDALRQGKVHGTWSPGKAFEYLVVRAFELENVKVTYPFAVTWPQKLGTVTDRWDCPPRSPVLSC